MSYLGELTLRLAAGTMRLDRGLCRRQAALFRRYETADGGFAGRARAGHSASRKVGRETSSAGSAAGDLYYTRFALGGLAMLGALDEPAALRAAQFLGERLGRPMPSIDFLSLVPSAVLLDLACGADVFASAGLDRAGAVSETLRPLRRGDGGYAKSAASAHSSTYHTFLAVSCLQLVGAAVEEPRRAVKLIRSRQRPDGGFVEIGLLTQSGSNPTAAAVGLLRLCDALDESIRRPAAAFLARMQNSEGGLRASSRAPAADLLSTFTGLVALSDLEVPAAIDAAAARRYVETLEHPDGGFRGGAWDNAADVEYTFYGLAALTLLAELAS